MSFDANWRLEVDPQVYKDLTKLPKSNIRRILGAIEKLSNSPYAGDIQKMRGEKNVWRRRVGEYRIFYEILTEVKVIHVFHAERRTSKTY